MFVHPATATLTIAVTTAQLDRPTGVPAGALTAGRAGLDAVAGHAGSALILALVVVTGGYLLRCWLRPFRACRRCHGTGTRRPFLGIGRVGWCRRCHGTGYTLRPGRRLINEFRDLRTGAHPRSTSRRPGTPGGRPGDRPPWAGGTDPDDRPPARTGRRWPR